MFALPLEEHQAVWMNVPQLAAQWLCLHDVAHLRPSLHPIDMLKATMLAAPCTDVLALISFRQSKPGQNNRDNMSCSCAMIGKVGYGKILVSLRLKVLRVPEKVLSMFSICCSQQEQRLSASPRWHRVLIEITPIVKSMLLGWQNVRRREESCQIKSGTDTVASPDMEEAWETLHFYLNNTYKCTLWKMLPLGCKSQMRHWSSSLSPGLMWVVRVPGWVAALSPLPPTPAEWWCVCVQWESKPLN